MNVSYNEGELSDIRKEIDFLVTRTGFDCNCAVAALGIMDAVAKLHGGKMDGYLGLSSDYFKYTRGECFVFASFLMTAMLRHGSMPGDFNVSRIIPIPKAKNMDETRITI